MSADDIERKWQAGEGLFRPLRVNGVHVDSLAEVFAGVSFSGSRLPPSDAARAQERREEDERRKNCRYVYVAPPPHRPKDTRTSIEKAVERQHASLHNSRAGAAETKPPEKPPRAAAARVIPAWAPPTRVLVNARS